VSFSVDVYDPSLPLVIDPVLFSTYLGGNGSDKPSSLVVDSQGGVYMTGTTESTNFPTKGGLQSREGGGTDAFVTKLDGTTGAIVYSTYIGGSGHDIANQIKADAAGSAYVVGSTNSLDFPTTKGAFQTALLGPRRLRR
jgi:hypothetical protein